MRVKKRKTGNIVVPKGTVVLPHEFVVATILSWTGEDVEFLPAKHSRTADIKFRGMEWEIKSPIGKSSRTIENNLRCALKQSRNVIIDLNRIKQSEDKAVKEVRRQCKLIRGRKRVVVIAKSKDIIDINL